MKPSQLDKVVADCDEALKLDARYLKALNRRANALESLGRFKESLRGASRRIFKIIPRIRIHIFYSRFHGVDYLGGVPE